MSYDFEILTPHPSQSYVVLSPRTPRACAWLNRHVYDDAPAYGGLGVPRQCLPELMDDILRDSLTIRGPRESGHSR